MRTRRRGRELALKLLYSFDMLPRSLDQMLQDFWRLTKYPEEMRIFAEQLVRGTLKHKDEIDALIVENAINWKIERMAVIDRNILRYAIYELIFEEMIPPKVTINEALDIAKKYSTPKSSAFINGILDNIHHSLTKTKPETPPKIRRKKPKKAKSHEVAAN